MDFSNSVLDFVSIFSSILNRYMDMWCLDRCSKELVKHNFVGGENDIDRSKENGQILLMEI